MKKILLPVLLLFAATQTTLGQEGPNLVNAATLSPTTEKASKMGAENVNIFAGVPQIGVPLYSYSNPASGLSMSISLDYFAGGTSLVEAPTTVGLGWYLNAGGIITRTVRGLADEGGEYNINGFLNTDSIPEDFRSKGITYYSDSLDAEQDIFQYNFGGRSGSFYIGKNGQIAQVPLTKMKIVPVKTAYEITGFRFTTEDGVKYEFSDPEFSTFLLDGGKFLLDDYNSSWSLTRIISPFNTDTISLHYVQKKMVNSFQYPQLTWVRNTDGVRTKDLIGTSGMDTTFTNKIAWIDFPDKTKISFIYGTVPYYPGDNALSMIKVSDTALRYGYILDYQLKDSTGHDCRVLLKSVTPCTSTQKGKGYSFDYYYPLLVPAGVDTLKNRQDYWGYYNGAHNDSTSIPKINGYTWGADRTPNLSYAIASTLKGFYLPTGGVITYEYELNDHFPYTREPHTVVLNATSAWSGTVNFSQVLGTRTNLRFVLDSSLSRQGAPPLSGAATMMVNVKSTDGSVTYASYLLPLYDLFYKGVLTWDFNVPSGSYEFNNGEIGGGRLAYRLTGGSASLLSGIITDALIGSEAGPWGTVIGIVIGLSTPAGEMFYDKVLVPAADKTNDWLHQYIVDPISHWSTSLSSGWHP